MEELYSNTVLRTKLREHLDKIYDIERLCSKIACGTINPRDCVALSRSLRQIGPVLDGSTTGSMAGQNRIISKPTAAR